MRGLMLMPDVPWPVSGGREIYSHHLLRAFLDAGHDATVVVTDSPDADRLTRWPLHSRLRVVPIDGQSAGSPLPPADRADQRWRRYWGWDRHALGRLRDAIDTEAPHFVAAAGLDMLPALPAAPASTPRLWLALDEPALYQRSLAAAATTRRERAKRRRLAAAFARYERAYANRIDAAVAVSQRDAQQLQRIADFEHVLNMPNGVDADYFRPIGETSEPHTAVFWGRLDFPPNIDAVTWFLSRAWPLVRAMQPDAKLRIIGRNPGDAVRAAADGVAGVDLVGPVDDLRGEACRAAAVVLPMQSGAGIKNKLLEAAALARPVVASPLAVDGLESDHAWRIAQTPQQWADQLVDLWRHPDRADAMGGRARRWVRATHRWDLNVDRLTAFVADHLAATHATSGRRAA
jgi:glycosyltransferase involved in cell wall biosynthesis